ncbi:PepSY domain-containing protein [Nannocystaceae bacterium ST9]
MPRLRALDLLALTFATLGTLALVQLRQSGPCERESADMSASEQALAGLIDAESAARVGGWWLDEPTTATRLSFDPAHDRLVWQVSGREGRVLLDAETGEALAFEFDRVRS